MRISRLCFIAAITVAASSFAVARADAYPPLTLTISQDQARVADALQVLQTESGLTMVIDGTVNGHMGPAKVSFASMDEMLVFLRSVEPGLTWARLYLPAKRPVPTGDQCYDIVRTLQWLGQQGNPTLITQTSAITVVSEKAAKATPPAGQREIWYVSDEMERTQQYLDAQKALREAQQQQQQNTLPPGVVPSRPRRVR
ncbi:MAG: hypothetical protein P4L33_12810 [Capsulimonadaceae bacterium]|nr:hypothetical protein [Capsulimonadaceae bacterium]